MKTALLFIFAVAFLAVASPVSGQTGRISQGDYNTALMKALESGSGKNRRVVTAETFYSGARVVGSRKIVSEFAGPDAKWIRVTEEFGDSGSKRDSIRIGDELFCRDAEKNWKRAGKDCTNSATLVIPDGDYEYFAETDAKDPSRKIYVRRATFKDAGLAERDAARLKFIEIKFAADNSGIVEYTETRRGGIEPNGWSSTQVTKYEYDPKDLKIESPSQ